MGRIHCAAGIAGGVSPIATRSPLLDVILMILYCTIVLGILVVIHEGGHYLA